MQQLETEHTQQDITASWNKLGLEGEGDALKLAAQHCLLGVQDALSQPKSYTWLEKFSVFFQSHPQFNEFQSFRREMETGNYTIHFSLERASSQSGEHATYLATWVTRADHNMISPQVKHTIEKWAALIGFEILENDINRILRMQHEQPLTSSFLTGVKPGGTQKG